MPPGPAPKAPELRQRRNRTSTAAHLTEDGAAKIRAPKLPTREGQEWHSLTKAWWRDVWRSPMAPEYLQADTHGLYLLADLIDRYWTQPDVKLAGEIRQQRQCFGITPLDRRRLQWTVQRVEEGRKPVSQPKDEAKAARDDFDPRKLLMVAN